AVAVLPQVSTAVIFCRNEVPAFCVAGAGTLKLFAEAGPTAKLAEGALIVPVLTVSVVVCASNNVMLTAALPAAKATLCCPTPQAAPGYDGAVPFGLFAGPLKVRQALAESPCPYASAAPSVSVNAVPAVCVPGLGAASRPIVAAGLMVNAGEVACS